MIHSGNEGYDKSLSNPVHAYTYLSRSLSYGVNSFDDTQKYFNDHYAELAPLYVFARGLPVEVNSENETNIRNMHSAMLTDMKKQFSAALSKD